jgi:hypothetical protein
MLVPEMRWKEIKEMGRQRIFICDQQIEHEVNDEEHQGSSGAIVFPCIWRACIKDNPVLKLWFLAKGNQITQIWRWGRTLWESYWFRVYEFHYLYIPKPISCDSIRSCNYTSFDYVIVEKPVIFDYKLSMKRRIMPIFLRKEEDGEIGERSRINV